MVAWLAVGKLALIKYSWHAASPDPVRSGTVRDWACRARWFCRSRSLWFYCASKEAFCTSYGLTSSYQSRTQTWVFRWTAMSQYAGFMALSTFPFSLGLCHHHYPKRLSSWIDSKHWMTWARRHTPLPIPIRRVLVLSFWVCRCSWVGRWFAWGRHPIALLARTSSSPFVPRDRQRPSLDALD